MTVENFVRMVWTVFAKIKKVKNWLFFGHFRVNFGYVFLTSQPYEFNKIAHKGP